MLIHTKNHILVDRGTTTRNLPIPHIAQIKLSSKLAYFANQEGNPFPNKAFPNDTLNVFKGIQGHSRAYKGIQGHYIYICKYIYIYTFN